jgi:hypothetical protein
MLFDPKAQKMDGADPNEGENTQHGHMTGNLCISAPLPNSPLSSACGSKTMKDYFLFARQNEAAEATACVGAKHICA